MNDFESRLRASLRRHAKEAPDGDRLAERILRDTSARPTTSRRRREWRTWTFPLATAGAVAAIAAALVGVNQVHHHSAAPANSVSPAPSVLMSPLPTGAPSGLPTPTTTAPPSQATLPPTLHGVRVLDATFVGPKDGWLLASADCLDGKPGKCSAMLRTTDDGQHWTSMPNPPVNVFGVKDCATRCVDEIRFANKSTGYVFGGYASDAFFMTTDGGKSWQQQESANVVALETYDNNVIRVTTTDPGCGPPGCTYQVQTAAIGSSTWSTPTILTTSGGGMTSGAQLVRGGDHSAYVLVTGHPAGGSGTAFSTLFRSSDDGATWTSSAVNAGEPCPQAGGEVDSTLVAAGGGDRVSVVCATRQAPQHGFVAVSADAGAHFVATARAPWLGTRFLVGDPNTVLVAAGGSHVYRSADGGRSWQRVTLPDFSGNVSWVGFESTRVGRIVGAGGNTIWTTQDGGEHWTALPLG